MGANGAVCVFIISCKFAFIVYAIKVKTISF